MNSSLPSDLKTGPSISALLLWRSGGGRRVQLLSGDDRAQLASIATIVRFRKGEQIYREGEPAVAIFNIVHGVAKCYKALANNHERISGFLFEEDLFGLAEEGKYFNSSKAVSDLSAYRIPVVALERAFLHNASMAFQVINQLCQDLRQLERQIILLGCRSGVAKLSAFLLLQKSRQFALGGSSKEFVLPMSQKDIAGYVGMSVEAVCRSLRALQVTHVIRLTDRHSVEILNEEQLNQLANSISPEF